MQGWDELSDEDGINHSRVMRWGEDGSQWSGWASSLSETTQSSDLRHTNSGSRKNHIAGNVKSYIHGIEIHEGQSELDWMLGGQTTIADCWRRIQADPEYHRGQWCNPPIQGYITPTRGKSGGVIMGRPRNSWDQRETVQEEVLPPNKAHHPPKCPPM